MIRIHVVADTLVAVRGATCHVGEGASGNRRSGWGHRGSCESVGDGLGVRPLRKRAREGDGGIRSSRGGERVSVVGFRFGDFSAERWSEVSDAESVGGHQAVGERVGEDGRSVSDGKRRSFSRFHGDGGR